MKNNPALIALDWGTSSFRGYLLDKAGAILDTTSAPLGILQVPGGDFDGTYTQLVGPWLKKHGNLPAITSGMIGSRQGWHEAPYASCPTNAEELVKKTVSIKPSAGGTLCFVPGVDYVNVAGVPDVIRGEECQIIGQLALGAKAGKDGTIVFVMPGTHSKWVLVKDDTLIKFSTFMTGEVFAILEKHSILGRLMPENAASLPHDDAAFRRGLKYAAATGQQGGLLNRLFSTRTLGLFDKVPATGLRSYLSGLMIGTEIVEALSCFTGTQPLSETPITIIANTALTEIYETALSVHGLTAVRGAPDAVVPGLVKIARAAQLM